MAMGSATRRDRSEPLTRLVRFEATDGVELSGVFYEPRRSSARVVVYLHGTGGSSVFSSRKTNVFGARFAARGIAFFAFDNRGSHLVRRLGDTLGGMAFERIRDCVHDIDGALRFLRRLGYRDVTVVGHSTGANKIAVYDFYKERNPVRRYVLLAGGDDVGLLFDSLGARRFRSVLARARKLRRSLEFAPRAISALPMSWGSLYDMMNPDGDYNVFPFLEAMGRVRLSRRRLFRHLRQVRKPTLLVYGDRDEYCFGDVSGCVGAMAGALSGQPNLEFVIMGDADHGFGGREGELVEMVENWMS